ncbi:hypothetical protein HYV86_01040 [Candidatus Woesearchaeota archaeon]|nr:hypothetical protein [Candidatus Woesearchaeota archaeon]
MLYTHKLGDLGRRTVENESIDIVRDIKQKFRFPFNEQAMSDYFARFRVQDAELAVIEKGIPLCEPTAQMVEGVLALNDETFEPINLQRTVVSMRSVPTPLVANLAFSWELAQGHDEFVKEFTAVLNSLPRLRTQEEKMAANAKVNSLFAKLLRNSDFSFRSNDIIHEGQVTMLQGLLESIQRGYFFHYTLEEELKKIDFSELKRRIPAEHMARHNAITNNILQIQESVDKAYTLNFRMIELATYMYAFIKAVNNGM